MPGLKLLETSTILSLWVVCHGHSDLGRYHPLVGPVGIPRTWLILLLKIILAGSSPGLHGTPLYSLYTMGMCRWTGYGLLLALCRKGYMISWEFVNRVFPAGLIWFAGWILFVLQVHKSNDCNVPCSLAIANKWQRSYLWVIVEFYGWYHASLLFLCCKIEQTVIWSTYKPGNIVSNARENRRR